ncbi:MAG: PRC-barrel domain-containing protein [Thermoplasmata archaeon]
MVKKMKNDGRTTFNKIKGIKVYDAGGELFGHVDDIEINMSTMIPTHLIIHKGFFGGCFRVNIRYVDKIEQDKISLWISTIKNLVGTKVTDSVGTDIGTVKQAVKGKDGKLEYIQVNVRIVETGKRDYELNRYIVPMMPFEDFSLSLPAGSLEDEGVAKNVDLLTEEISLGADEIRDIHKDRIVLKKRKEGYLSK